jgi:hypothetical protein
VRILVFSHLYEDAVCREKPHEADCQCNEVMSETEMLWFNVMLVEHWLNTDSSFSKTTVKLCSRHASLQRELLENAHPDHNICSN